MKISRNTPMQLILDDQPWLIAVLLAGMMLICVSLGLGVVVSGDWVTGFVVILGSVLFLSLFLWAFVRRNQLILDGGSGTLTHRRRTMTRYRETVHDLAHLHGAVVQSSSGKNGATYRMAYVLTAGMDAGTHPFTTVYSSGSGARRGAQATNDWLAALRQA